MRTDLRVEPDLTGFDLVIATLITSLADTRDSGIHRTTLLALAQAGVSTQVLSELESSQGIGRLRALLAEALVSLRGRGAVRLEDDGFHLTDAGRRAVELALRTDSEGLRSKIAELLRQQGP